MQEKMWQKVDISQTIKQQRSNELQKRLNTMWASFCVAIFWGITHPLLQCLEATVLSGLLLKAENLLPGSKNLSWGLFTYLIRLLSVRIVIRAKQCRCSRNNLHFLKPKMRIDKSVFALVSKKVPYPKFLWVCFWVTRSNYTYNPLDLKYWVRHPLVVRR